MDANEGMATGPLQALVNEQEGRPNRFSQGDVFSQRDIATTSEKAPVLGGRSIQAAIQRTEEWLWDRQHEDGHWCAELEGDTILESEYVLLLAWLGRASSPRARQAARYIEFQQSESGGWSLFPGGPLDVSVSAKAYFSLKLTGTPESAPHMLRAREAIRAAGGADRVNSFTRFYLALLGQIPFHLCPAVPPELILLPDWSPVNIYRMSAWSRTIVVPLSIVWALQPVRKIDAELGMTELFLESPDRWPPLRSPGTQPSWHPFTWETFFRLADKLLKGCERLRIRPLRARALRSGRDWMLERFEDSDGLGAIFPPIIWSIIALRALGYSDEHAAVVECHQQLEALILSDSSDALGSQNSSDSPDSSGSPDSSKVAAIRLQPCKSPVWDTALAFRAMLAAQNTRAGMSPGDEDRVQRAVSWLLDREVRVPGDWQRRARVEPGGWFFEYRNAYYPDVDDTIIVILVLGAAAYRLQAANRCGSSATSDVEARRSTCSRIEQARDRAARWVLALQNRDGGWGAFDRDNDAEFLCHVPFADHNAMIDPSTPDITARVLESLATWGMQVNDPAAVRAIRYLRAAQEPDGSWYGRWGVNHIYGTWQVLVGLASMGIDSSDSAMRRGVQWLLEHQQESGGWGESPLSYGDAAWRGKGSATASQTAWALLGLIAAHCSDRRAIEQGVQFLLDTQRADGGWDEPEFTGTGFPQVFYLRYHMYPIYFPLLALSQANALLER